MRRPLRWLLYTLFFILNLFSSFAFSLSSIQIPLAPGIQCQQLNGHWQGMAVDQLQLFANKHPWPVQLNLITKKQTVIGIIKGLPFSQSAYLWAQCHKGKLTSVYVLGKAKHCGQASLYASGLLTPNLLMLSIHYENAMTGTIFISILHKMTKLTQWHPPSAILWKKPLIRTCH